jgi:hypothetical protein
MADLTCNERHVLDIVRGAPVRPAETWWIANRAAALHGLGYRRTVRALLDLVAKGRLARPRRGAYRMTEASVQDAGSDGFYLQPDHRPGCLCRDDEMPFVVYAGWQFERADGHRHVGVSWHTFRCNDPDCSALLYVRADILGRLLGERAPSKPRRGYYLPTEEGP